MLRGRESGETRGACRSVRLSACRRVAAPACVQRRSFLLPVLEPPLGRFLRSLLFVVLLQHPWRAHASSWRERVQQRGGARCAGSLQAAGVRRALSQSRPLSVAPLLDAAVEVCSRAGQLLGAATAALPAHAVDASRARARPDVTCTPSQIESTRKTPTERAAGLQAPAVVGRTGCAGAQSRWRRWADVGEGVPWLRLGPTCEPPAHHTRLERLALVGPLAPRVAVCKRGR